MMNGIDVDEFSISPARPDRCSSSRVRPLPARSWPSHCGIRLEPFR